jgi:pimeloyl-ACP methyl ester carboxylesterase
MLIAEYTFPAVHVRDHMVPVPLDWRSPDGDSIDLFARELVAPQRRHEDLPLLLFLQGGPGGKATRPTDTEGWVGVALERYRIVLMDQRGTGRSTRVDAAWMARMSAIDGAEFLTRFRADSIIRDAEHLRRTVFEGRRWATLGQSYGGFLTLTYLSLAPEALTACFVTGGLASITPSAAEVYRRTYPRAETKNAEYRRRYPADVAAVGRIADRLAVGDVQLPDGDALTVRRFQHLGLDLGMQPGHERLHWLVDEAFASSTGDLSDTFLQQVQERTSYADDPLFTALQEAIYGDEMSGPTAWAAQAERDRRPEFAETARPLQFTAEMIYPWMFDDIRLLRPFGPAVRALAERADWAPLYDRRRLAQNEVPVAAAVYADDLYVDADLQRETAAAVGAVQAWVTNEYEHDGFRQDDRVLRRLFQLVDDRGGPLR